MCMFSLELVCSSLPPPSLTSPTCDSQRGSDPLTPAGTHKSLLLVDFSFMLAGQRQDGKREGRKQRKENKYKPETIHRKRKNSIHLSLNLVVNDHQLGLVGRKGKKKVSGFQVNFRVNVATFLVEIKNGD